MGDYRRPKSIFYSPALFAAIRLIGSTIASLPWVVYQRTSRGRQRAEWHPTYEVLKARPNPHQTAYQFFEQVVNSIFYNGNFYALKEQKVNLVNGTVVMDTVGLYPLDPTRVEVKIENRQKIFLIDRGKTKLEPDQVLHVAGYSRDGVVGQPLTTYLMDAVALGQEARSYNLDLLRNGGSPFVALKTQSPLKKEDVDRLRDSYKATFSELERNGVIVLHGGLELQKISLNPEEAKLNETIKLADLDVARMLGIPPHMLGLIDKASYASIEHQSIEFVQYCLRPWLVRLEQALTVDLFWGQPFFVEAQVDGLLRGDVESRYKAYATARQWGWLSTNDIRRLENLPPIDGGDDYLTPLNMSVKSRVKKINAQIGLFDEEVKIEKG